MARSNQFRPQARFRSQRRAVSWDDVSFGDSTVITATSNTLIATGFALTSEPETTLVRLRGLVRMQLASSNGIGSGFDGAVGICLVATPAFAAGVASVPSPLDEAAYPWIYYQHFNVRGQIGSEVTGDMAFQRLVIDSKAMRKWNEDQTLIFVIQAIEEGVCSMEVTVGCRALIKLT